MYSTRCANITISQTMLFVTVNCLFFSSSIDPRIMCFDVSTKRAGGSSSFFSLYVGRFGTIRCPTRKIQRRRRKTMKVKVRTGIRMFFSRTDTTKACFVGERQGESQIEKENNDADNKK